MEQRFRILEDSIRGKRRSAACACLSASKEKRLWFWGSGSQGGPARKVLTTRIQAWDYLRDLLVGGPSSLTKF